MKQSKKPSFVLWAACILLCLVLISAHFTSGLYAKFIVNAAGSDAGRAASFRVGAEMTDKDGVYELTFTNSAETAVAYSVVVQPKDSGMFSVISLDGAVAPTPDENGSVTFENVGKLAPGAAGRAALTLTVDPNYVDPDAVSELLDFSNDSTSSAETELPFTVTVTFEQVN